MKLVNFFILPRDAAMGGCNQRMYKQNFSHHNACMLFTPIGQPFNFCDFAQTQENGKI